MSEILVFLILGAILLAAVAGVVGCVIVIQKIAIAQAERDFRQ